MKTNERRCIACGNVKKITEFYTGNTRCKACVFCRRFPALKGGNVRFLPGIPLDKHGWPPVGWIRTQIRVVKLKRYKPA